MDTGGWGYLPMYMGSDWEVVNSISLEYTCLVLPNLGRNTFHSMYSNVFRWTTIHSLQCYDYRAMPVRERVTCYPSLVDSRC
jgi:hypothetical protein